MTEPANTEYSCVIDLEKIENFSGQNILNSYPGYYFGSVRNSLLLRQVENRLKTHAPGFISLAGWVTPYQLFGPSYWLVNMVFNNQDEAIQWKLAWMR
jgi:hypothetical protein